MPRSELLNPRSDLLGSHQYGSFSAISDAELLQDMTNVHLDCDFADVQGSRDFGIRSPLRE